MELLNLLYSTDAFGFKLFQVFCPGQPSTERTANSYTYQLLTRLLTTIRSAGLSTVQSSTLIKVCPRFLFLSSFSDQFAQDIPDRPRISFAPNEQSAYSLHLYILAPSIGGGGDEMMCSLRWATFLPIELPRPLPQNAVHASEYLVLCNHPQYLARLLSFD